MDPDRWEFANEGFKGGKKHLLKNIKRRSKYNSSKHPIGALISNSGNPGLESEIENLKKDQTSMKAEILSLRRQQKDSHNQITAVEERIRCAECRHHQMLLFITKTAIKPSFVHQLMQMRRQKREIDGGAEIAKRRRILTTEEEEEEEKVRIQSLMSGDLGAAMDEGTDVLTASGAYNVVSENLLDDISVLEEELAVNDTKFYHELEDLIEKPRDRGGAGTGFFTGFVEQTGCIGPLL